MPALTPPAAKVEPTHTRCGVRPERVSHVDLGHLHAPTALYASLSAGASRASLMGGAVAPGLAGCASADAVDTFISEQSAVPYIAAVKARAERGDAIFIIPGHTQGNGFDSALSFALPACVARYDLAQTPELGNLLHRQGPVGHAQALAAQAFGAINSHFIVTGGTGATKAMVDATTREEQTLVLPRNAHTSAYLGLVASGAQAHYIMPELDTATGLALPLKAHQIDAALSAASQASAVLVVSPTVAGISADIAAIAQVTRRHQVALIVDQAWGAHFGFHPGLPASATTLGADLVAMSMHKKLDSSTQTALLHRCTGRVSSDRLQQAVERVSSTSPNSILLMSMDMARRRAACLGYHLLSATLAMCDATRAALALIKDIEVCTPDVLMMRHDVQMDPTTVIFRHGCFVDGLALAEALRSYGVQLILTEQAWVMALFSLSSPDDYGARLVAAVHALNRVTTPDVGARRVASPAPTVALPKVLITPRAASQADSDRCLLEDAVGRVCAENIMAYPPAVALVSAGERIGEDLLALIAHRKRHGAHVLGIDAKGCVQVVRGA